MTVSASPFRAATRESARARTAPGLRICLVRQFYFPLDMHTRRQVDAFLASGHEVDVVCLARPDEPRFEQRGRLRIHRLPLRHRRGHPLIYLYQYAVFLVAATLKVSVLHLQRRYRLVQVSTMPDTLVFAALVPKILGARVLLDLQECMPEFFATKFKAGLDHPAVRLIGRLEQASIRLADFAITCTEQMRQAFVARGAPSDKIGIIMISADEQIFDPGRYGPEPGRTDRFTLICHGCIEERYGLDTVIRAVALLKSEIPELRFEIYGEGAARGELRRLAHELAVEDRVWFSDGFVPMDELVRAIAAADVGVVAMKRDIFRDLTHCNKMYDFIAMGIPAIVSRTRSVEAYFPDSCFRYFTPGDPRDLARAIRELHADPELRRRLVDEARRASEPYRWPRQREKLLSIVERMVKPGASPNGTETAPRVGELARSGEGVGS